MNNNELAKQKKAAELAELHIESNVTWFVEDLLKANIEKGFEPSTFDIEELLDQLYPEDVDVDVEVYQWFLVSVFFADWAKENGEVIIDTALGYIWGRQTFGQSIALDFIYNGFCDYCE